MSLSKGFWAENFKCTNYTKHMSTQSTARAITELTVACTAMCCKTTSKYQVFCETDALMQCAQLHVNRTFKKKNHFH